MRKALFLLVALAACSPAKAPETSAAAPEAAAPQTAVAEPAATDAWLGKWIGVEGNTLTIEATGVKGAYAITEGTLDGVKRYGGKAEGDRIALVDAGASGAIRAATGDETGLKYLAGKTNCLVIESGRGFCR
jgi:hypothetical protein